MPTYATRNKAAEHPPGVATAVADAGGLGLSGAGHGDEEWLAEIFENAGNAPFRVRGIPWAATGPPARNLSCLMAGLTPLLVTGWDLGFSPQVQAAWFRDQAIA
jgi:hypothetical protein